MWACIKSLTEVALELLKVDGLDVNTQDRVGNTALMKACFHRLTEVVLGLLRDPRVDRHIKMSNGSNALVFARNKSLTAVVTLIEALDHAETSVGDAVGEGASSVPARR